MEEAPTSGPKTFLSYSWTTPEHEKWVVELAEDLEAHGIEVILDKWNLREGHDANAFMEQMVTDPKVTKVVLICDQMYADKANARKGGAGTEAQIISPEIYGKIDQSKFVAVVTEFDDDGNPFVPAFYKGRIHIDMSTPAARHGNLEQLIRWLYDKPIWKRPRRGSIPSFMLEEPSIDTGTRGKQRAAIAALKDGRAYAGAVFREYLDAFADGLSVLRIVGVPEGKAVDDLVVERIESSLPLRDELLDAFAVAIQYRDEDDTYEAIAAFLEQLLRYQFWPEGVKEWRDQYVDQFRFLLNETVIYIVALLLKQGKFHRARYLMERGYFLDGTGLIHLPNERLHSIEAFVGHLESLKTRNDRLNLRRLSVLSDTFKARATRADLSWELVMQADFVLFIWSRLHPSNYRAWFPHTLLYADYYRGPFEIFLRASSAGYMKNILDLFSMSDKNAFLTSFQNSMNGLEPRQWWQYNGFDPFQLMNSENLGTRL